MPTKLDLHEYTAVFIWMSPGVSTDAGGIGITSGGKVVHIGPMPGPGGKVMRDLQAGITLLAATARLSDRKLAAQIQKLVEPTVSAAAMKLTAARA